MPCGIPFSGVQPSIDRDAAHIDACLRAALLNHPGARVLITGCADYGLLALLLALDSEHSLNLRIDIIDTCDTPLAANRWYAAQWGAKITTYQANLFAFTAEQQYDLVIAHSFLGQFALAERPMLMTHWRDLLISSGHLIITVRAFADGIDRNRSSLDSENAREKAYAVISGLRSQHIAAPASPAEFETLLVNLFKARPTREVTTAAHLEALLSDAGFRVDQRLTRVAKNSGQDSLIGAPKQFRGAEMVTVRATKVGDDFIKRPIFG